MRRFSVCVTLLLAFLGFSSLSGCNSHASFPYDQSLCGNGQLDPVEACDMDEEHGDLRYNGPSCHDLEGYAGGTPGCVDCRLIHEGYCIPKKPCNAFQSTECPDGAACYFFPESQATGCAPWGGHAPGENCDDSSSCQPMSLCIDVQQKGKICVLMCDRSGPFCPGNTACLNADLPYPMGYCEPLELECDPITNNRCIGPEACYFFQELDPQVQCTYRSGNDAVEGEGCGSSEQCLPTLTCVNEQCRVLCNTGAECAPGQPCNEGLGFLDYGVCPVGKSCDPVTGDGCRGGVLACAFGDQYDGNRYCRLPGEVPEGGYCNSDDRCAPGLFCSALQSPDGTEICTPLCSGRKTCLDGKICALGSSDFLPGLCVVPASCSILSNDCPDARVCTIVNSVGETACVNPGPAQANEPCGLYQACGPGLFCDDLGNGNRACRYLCDRYNPPNCPQGGNCAEMFWEWDQVGVCK